MLLNKCLFAHLGGSLDSEDPGLPSSPERLSIILLAQGSLGISTPHVS